MHNKEKPVSSERVPGAQKRGGGGRKECRRQIYASVRNRWQVDRGRPLLYAECSSGTFRYLKSSNSFI